MDIQQGHAGNDFLQRTLVGNAYSEGGIHLKTDRFHYVKGVSYPVNHKWTENPEQLEQHPLVEIPMLSI